MRMALDRFTAFLIFQLFVALVVILLIVFRPGPWSARTMDGSRHRCSRCRAAVRGPMAVGQVVFGDASSPPACHARALL